MAEEFALDARLAADTATVAAWPLCELRLMREARWLWLILVPRAAEAAEIFDLAAGQQAQLMAEISAAAAALKQATGCDKVNIGALGNIVRQLHIHIIARNAGDAAWPGPVWGQGARQNLPPAAETRRLNLLRPLLARAAANWDKRD